MNNNEVVIQKIGYYRNVFTLLFPAVFVIGSGIIWAFFNVGDLARFMLVSIGSLIELITLIVVFYLHKNIRRLIMELSK